MNHPFSASERIRSMRHAWHGLKILINEEHNARVHLFATGIVIVLAVWLPTQPVEWLILILVIALVWLTEALNTALENLSDRITREHDELIGKAKDVAASAVFIASGAALLCGGIIFLPKIWRVFG